MLQNCTGEMNSNCHKNKVAQGRDAHAEPLLFYASVSDGDVWSCGGCDGLARLEHSSLDVSCGGQGAQIQHEDVSACVLYCGRCDVKAMMATRRRLMWHVTRGT